MDADVHIGRRLREIRSWRQLGLRATAELSGISYGHLGKIERGEQAVTSRRTLEALALTLRVSPTELTGQPWAPVDQVSSEAHAALHSIEVALESADLGHDPGTAIRDWSEIAADVAHLVDLAHVQSDYAGQGVLLPGLLDELHAIYVRQPEHRQAVLVGMLQCYASATWTTKRLGGRGLPAIAARLAQQAAEHLDQPQWQGFAVWLRGDATGQLDRAAQYRRSVSTAESLTPRMDDADVTQMAGMLHLSAALAAAAQHDSDTAGTHLDEAAALAERQAADVGEFARLWFGRTNVGIWRTAIGLELGQGPQVAEQARSVRIEAMPSTSRQAEFWADVGRSQLGESTTRAAGLGAILRAEQLSPQRIRADVFVREAVADELRRARRDAGGRELRGIAWRMGVAPTG